MEINQGFGIVCFWKTNVTTNQLRKTYATTSFRWTLYVLIGKYDFFLIYVILRITYMQSYYDKKKYTKRHVNEVFIGKIFKIKSVCQLYSKCFVTY